MISFLSSSRRNFVSSLLGLSLLGMKIIVRITPTQSPKTITKIGKSAGNVVKTVSVEKVCGNCSLGNTKKPLILGPVTYPKEKADRTTDIPIGIVSSSQKSANMALDTIICPILHPCRKRVVVAQMKLVLKPNISVVSRRQEPVRAVVNFLPRKCKEGNFHIFDPIHSSRFIWLTFKYSKGNDFDQFDRGTVEKHKYD